MPRSVTAKVSAYQRSRTWRAEFVRGEVFSLSADFTGVLGSATITASNWKVNETGSVILGTATDTTKVASVGCTAGYGSGGLVKCQATASDGKVYIQVFAVSILTGPTYSGETMPAAGNASVSA